jgi:ubiquinone/menaquinone biosynthesis C-methylase UbiE
MDATHAQPTEGHPAPHGHHHRPLTGLYGFVAGLSMRIGQGGRTRQVIDLARVSPGERVVDVGCGPGVAVRELARRGATVTGVDPSPVMLRLARRTIRSHQGASLLEGTAESLPLDDDSVDVAIAVASAHHWDDHEAALRELHRVLVPGGRLVIAERLVTEGARGHAAHGASSAAGTRLVGHAADAGFTGARVDTVGKGVHTLFAVIATNGG